MASGSTPAWIPAMTPDLLKVLAVKTAGSRSASAASSLRMVADLEAELFNGLLEGEQERAIAHTAVQAVSAFFPGLKGADRAAELVGALVKGHMLAVAIEVILVANYWHTKCTMVGCSDNGHLVKLGEDCAGYTQCAKHVQNGEELGG